MILWRSGSREGEAGLYKAQVTKGTFEKGTLFEYQRSV